jgi:predicted nuclease of restriction endonuclease-like (RecB) superfamily
MRGVQLIQSWLTFIILLDKKLLNDNSSLVGGKSIVEQLAKDLQTTFPGNNGFSTRNLWDMRRLYERYSHYPNLRQAVAEIPWGHHLLILNKIDLIEEAEFYIKQVSTNGWSRNVLLNFINTVKFELV